MRWRVVLSGRPMNARNPDREAVTLLRRRDPRGFDLAYAAHAGRVHAFLLRLSGRRNVADDLLQHVFLRLAERGPELRADSELRAWLLRVARNAYLDLRRAHGADADDTGLETLACPPADVEARLLLGDVERALAALRFEDREVLSLVGIEGFTPQQAAALLGIRDEALRQRLARARARLLAELERLPRLARLDEPSTSKRSVP